MNKKELAEALLKRKACRGKKFTRAQEEAIITAYLDGKTVAQLAKLHGCSAGPVNAVIDRAISEGMGE